MADRQAAARAAAAHSTWDADHAGAGAAHRGCCRGGSETARLVHGGRVAEPSGALVHFLKMDNTQYASIKLAIAKAETAAKYRRPTKMFTDSLAAGHQFFLTFEGICAAPGGLPLVADGKLIGAIGVSGGSGSQDDVVAEAGVAALK